MLVISNCIIAMLALAGFSMTIALERHYIFLPTLEYSTNFLASCCGVYLVSLPCINVFTMNLDNSGRYTALTILFIVPSQVGHMFPHGWYWYKCEYV